MADQYSLINDYMYIGVYKRDNINDILSKFYNDYLQNKEIFYTNINNSNDLNYHKSFIDLLNPYIILSEEELFYIKLKYDFEIKP